VLSSSSTGDEMTQKAQWVEGSEVELLSDGSTLWKADYEAEKLLLNKAK